MVVVTKAKSKGSNQKNFHSLINSAAINFNDYHDAKIESNIDNISWKIAWNQRIQQYWKSFVKLNNIICGCYIIRAYNIDFGFWKREIEKQGVKSLFIKFTYNLKKSLTPSLVPRLIYLSVTHFFVTCSKWYNDCFCYQDGNLVKYNVKEFDSFQIIPFVYRLFESR